MYPIVLRWLLLCCRIEHRTSISAAFLQQNLLIRTKTFLANIILYFYNWNLFSIFFAMRDWLRKKSCQMTQDSLFTNNKTMFPKVERHWTREIVFIKIWKNTTSILCKIFIWEKIIHIYSPLWTMFFRSYKFWTLSL